MTQIKNCSARDDTDTISQEFTSTSPNTRVIYSEGKLLFPSTKALSQSSPLRFLLWFLVRDELHPVFLDYFIVEMLI